MIAGDHRYDHNRLRVNEDTLRGCRIGKIYPLTDGADHRAAQPREGARAKETNTQGRCLSELPDRHSADRAGMIGKISVIRNNAGPEPAPSREPP